MLCLAARPRPEANRRLKGRGDIVDPSPIWLKSLSHYRNRKNSDFSWRNGGRARAKRNGWNDMPKMKGADLITEF